MRVVFFGTADFGLPSLQLLRQRGHDIVGVVSSPDRPQGRGLHLQSSAVTTYARSSGLGPIITPESPSDPALPQTLRALAADAFVVIAYRILPEPVFTIPAMGTFNVHASLLPRYRGPAPIHRAIEQGERETGVSVFRIDSGVDTGGILWQERCAIGDSATTPELYEQLSQLGAVALDKALAGLANGSIRPVAQDVGAATKAPKLRKEEARMDWGAPAHVLHNRIRAFKPFPGTYTTIGKRRLGIEWAQAHADGDRGVAPGSVVRVGPEWFDVSCGKGTLRIERVKPEGKAAMDAGAFMRGTPVREGTLLT